VGSHPVSWLSGALAQGVGLAGRALLLFACAKRSNQEKAHPGEAPATPVPEIDDVLGVGRTRRPVSFRPPLAILASGPLRAPPISALLKGPRIKSKSKNDCTQSLRSALALDLAVAVQSLEKRRSWRRAQGTAGQDGQQRTK